MSVVFPLPSVPAAPSGTYLSAADKHLLGWMNGALVPALNALDARLAALEVPPPPPPPTIALVVDVSAAVEQQLLALPMGAVVHLRGPGYLHAVTLVPGSGT